MTGGLSYGGREAAVQTRCKACRSKFHFPADVATDLLVCDDCLLTAGRTDPHRVVGYWHGCLGRPDRSMQEVAYWAGFADGMSGGRGGSGGAQRRVQIVRCYPGMDPDEAILAYTSQRNNAQKRGVGWCFDLLDWCAVWHESGRWPERGVLSTQFVMARNGDVGPYARENVRIISMAENSREAWINKPKTQRLRSGNEVPHHA